MTRRLLTWTALLGAVLLGAVLFAFGSCSGGSNYVGTGSGSTPAVTTTYTVTFEVNGGSEVSSQTVESGKTATEPTKPEKSGYTFGGWYDDSALTSAFSFSTEITKDTTLYAKWIPGSTPTYTVSFETDGGSAVTSQTVAGGERASEPAAPTKTNLTFGGWYADSGLTSSFDFSSAISADTVVHAKWVCTVTFEVNGGSAVEKQTVEVNGTATKPTDPEKSGRTFNDWYTSNAYSATKYDFTAAVTENTTIYARWWTSSVFISGRDITIGNITASDHEVTQSEYETYCTYGSSTPSGTYGAGTDYPAYYVSWYDALVYCNKRSMAESLTPCYTIGGTTDPAQWPDAVSDGAGKYCGPSSDDATWNAATCDFTANGWRLPTEAEWEWLARGGDSEAEAWEKTYAGSDTLGDVAWYTMNSGDTTPHEVKQKAANSKGLYDMSGNVWEWCWDWDGTIAADTPADGAVSGSRRVLRGGSRNNIASNCAVSYRDRFNPDSRINFVLGFRVVRSSSE